MEKNTSSYFISLTPDEQEIILDTLRISFNDFPNFDFMVADKLRQLLIDVNNTKIDEIISTKKVTDKYFDTKSFKDTPERKLLFTQIQLIFKCCIVLILKFHPDLQHTKWFSVEELLKQYEHHSCYNNLSDLQEIQFLLEFRNSLRVALEIIPPAAHKQLLINIAGRLEGSNCVEYITGGGQKPCVQRRVAIYEQEGNVQRGTKIKKPVTENPGKKYAGHEYVSVRKIQKAVATLTAEEIERLKRPRVSFEESSHIDFNRSNNSSSMSLPDLDYKFPGYEMNKEGEDDEEYNKVSVSADYNTIEVNPAAIEAVKTSRLNLLGIRLKPIPVTRYTTFGPVDLQEVNKVSFDTAFFDNAEQQVLDRAAANTLLNISRESSSGSATDELLRNLDDTVLEVDGLTG